MTPKPKVIKRSEVLVVMRDDRHDDTMRRHELAMLKLLCSKHPAKAREYLDVHTRKVVDIGRE